MRTSILALALLAAVSAPVQAATIIQHPDLVALQGALSDIRLEDFEDMVLTDGLTIGGTATGTIATGMLYRQVRADRPTIFNFAEPTFGFGGTIRSGGFGTLAITLTFDDGTQQTLAPFALSPTDAFLGFSSDVGIRSIDVRSATAANASLYLADLTFGDAAIAGTVPEPAQWAMLIIGFGMIGGTMRRRRTPQPLLA